MGMVGYLVNGDVTLDRTIAFERLMAEGWAVLREHTGFEEMTQRERLFIQNFVHAPKHPTEEQS
jgi:hypothetical protein